MLVFEYLFLYIYIYIYIYDVYIVILAICKYTVFRKKIIIIACIENLKQ